MPSKCSSACASAPEVPSHAEVSRREPLRIAREHAALADIVEAEEEHHDALEPDAAAGVGEGAVLERVDVRLDRREVDGRLHRRGAREQHLRVVDPLGARGDLLAADEDVVPIERVEMG